MVGCGWEEVIVGSEKITGGVVGGVGKVRSFVGNWFLVVTSLDT